MKIVQKYGVRGHRDVLIAKQVLGSASLYKLSIHVHKLKHAHAAEYILNMLVLGRVLGKIIHVHADKEIHVLLFSLIE
jgi:hypothetical protein